MDRGCQSGSAVYRRLPGINQSTNSLPFQRPNSTGWPLTSRGKVYAAGLGTWAPTDLNYNISTLSRRGLTRWVAQVGMDESYCQHNAFGAPPWMCHDVDEFASVRAKLLR